MKRSNLFLIAFITAIVFVLPHSAPAAIVGIEGLAVEVDTIPASATTTDPDGWFSIVIPDAGDYTLLVNNPGPLSIPSATLEFTVDPLKVNLPAVIWGSVAFDDGLAASLIVLADVIGEDEIGPFSIRMKSKWNSNYSHSRGKIKVDIRGMMADAVGNVTLSSEEPGVIGLIEADSISYNSGGTKVKANFTKQTAYEALIPPTAVRGEMIPITITVDTIAGPQIEVVTVKILGRK
jgi:hypothetical protein